MKKMRLKINKSYNSSGELQISYGRTDSVFGIKLSPDDFKLESEWHAHPAWNICLLNSGSLGKQTENSSNILSPDILCVVPPHLQHTKFMCKNAYGECLFIPVDLIDFLPRDKIIFFHLDNLLKHLIQKLIHEVQSDTQDHDLISKMNTCLIELIRRASLASELTLPLPKSKALQIVTKMVLDNLVSSKTIKDYAGFAKMSSRNFSVLFKAETGLTFPEWRQRAKIQASIALLRRKISVKEVAFQLGFTDATAFTKVFKKHVGCTPVQFLDKKFHSST